MYALEKLYAAFYSSSSSWARVQLLLAYWSSVTCTFVESWKIFYVQEAAIGAVSKVDSRFFVWNLLKHWPTKSMEKSVGASTYICFKLHLWWVRYPKDQFDVRQPIILLYRARMSAVNVLWNSKRLKTCYMVVLGTLSNAFSKSF